MTHADYDARASDARLLAAALDAHGSQLALAAAIAYRRETVGRWVALARANKLRLTPRARRDLRASLPPDVPQPEE